MIFTKIYLKAILSILIITLLYGCKEDKIEFNPENPFRNIENVETQIFELDTLSQEIIVGKKGTQIRFIREDFIVNDNDKVVVELQEFYTRTELILANLNTVTDKNELLESNGVIYLDFKVEDNSIELRDGRKVAIGFANSLRDGDRIYKGAMDSLNQITWIRDDDVLVPFKMYDTLATRAYGGVETYKEITVSIDSLEFYQRLNDSIISDFEQESRWRYPSILTDNYGWINVDRIVEPNANISIELSLEKNDVDFINAYFVYNDLNSFISEYRKPDNLIFNEIPIKNKTYVVVVSLKDGVFFADYLLLNENTEGKIQINLKEWKMEDLKKFLKE